MEPQKTKDIIISLQSTVQELTVGPNFAKIMIPARIVVAGPTMAGKSEFILNLVKHRDSVFSEEFKRIIYAIPEESMHLHGSYLERLKQACASVQIHEGLPDLDMLHLCSEKSHKLLILDDLADQVFTNKQMLHLITKNSHHANCSLIITTQNYYFPTKYGKTFMRNCSEKIFFFDKSDAHLFSTISSQTFPSHPGFLKYCFDWIYREQPNVLFKYVVLDSSSLSEFPRAMLARTNILPDEHGVVRPIFFFPEEK